MMEIIPQSVVDYFSDLVESAFESGYWDVLPFRPRRKHNDCMGRGMLGYATVRVKPTCPVKYFPQRVFCPCLIEDMERYFGSQEFKSAVEDLCRESEHAVREDGDQFDSGSEVAAQAH